MADTEAPKIVESTVEEKKVEEKEKVVEATKAAAKVEENGDKVENGDSKEDKVENGDSKEEPKEKPATEPTDKCCIKRKSTGDAVDGKAETATPEKKAKITDSPLASATTETVAAESNGDEVTEAEAAA